MLRCIFTGRPSLGGEAVAWFRDGNAVDLGDFNQSGTIIDGIFPFGMSKGFRSDLEFTHEGPYTCDNIRYFDGKYQCAVTSNNRTVASDNMSTKSLCTFISFLIICIFVY